MRSATCRRARTSTSRSRSTSAGVSARPGWSSAASSGSASWCASPPTSSIVATGAGQAHGQGRRPHRRHLRAAGQDRLRAEPGPERGAARHRDRRASSGKETRVGRGLRELRARHDEPAAGVARLDRAGDRRVRRGDPARPRVRRRRGRRSAAPTGSRARSSRISDLVAQGPSRWSGARSRSIPISPTRTCGSATALLQQGEDRRRDRVDPGGDPARSARTARRIRRWRARCGSARAISPAAIPAFRKAIELNPRSRLLVPAARAAAGVGGAVRARPKPCCKRAVELQDQYISGNAGLQVVGANARLGYVYYLQGRYEDAIREYERGLAFLGSSDHALKERTEHRDHDEDRRGLPSLGKAEEAARLLRSRDEDVRARASRAAPTIRSRATTSPASSRCAARPTARFDSLERVAARCPR